MNLPLRLLVPARFRRSAPPRPRPAPGPPPIAIDYAAAEITKVVPAEQLEWLRARARVA